MRTSPTKTTLILGAATIFSALGAPLLAQQAPKLAEASVTTNRVEPATEPKADIQATVDTLLATQLLEIAASEAPQILPKVIESVQQGIVALCPDEGARHAARILLCHRLLKLAPAFGLVDFEELDASPALASPNALFYLRLHATSVYLEEARPDPAGRLLRRITEMEGLTDGQLAQAWLWRSMTTKDVDQRRVYLDKAQELFERSPEGPFPALIARAFSGDSSKFQDIIEYVPQADTRREWAIAVTLATASQYGLKQLTLAQAKTYLLKAYNALEQTDVQERLGDLMCFAATVRDIDPEMALNAVSTAETLANQSGANPECLRLARLFHAKMLRATGKTDELAKYADVNVDEGGVASWRWFAGSMRTTIRSDSAPPSR